MKENAVVKRRILDGGGSRSADSKLEQGDKKSQGGKTGQREHERRLKREGKKKKAKSGEWFKKEGGRS